jgi:hypothetical protein
MPHGFCSNWPDSRPEGRVWSAATRRRSGNRVLAGQRQLAAVFRRDQCWLQAHCGNPGSKLPVWGITRLLKTAPGRRTKGAMDAMRQKL